MARALFARVRPWLWVWPYLFVAITFVVSRLIYRGSYGLRFDGSPLFYFIQYMDPWFIENDFLRSVLYLHQQAPIPNFFVGVVYLLFGEHAWYYILDGVLAAFGLVLAFALLTSLIRFGTPRAVAAPVVALFMATPVAVLYEMWLFYHVPVAALLLCALIALFRFYRLGTVRAGLLFFGLLAAVAFIRNVYGSVWLLAITGALLVIPPTVFPRGSTARRTVLKAAAIPLLSLLALGARPRLLLGPGLGDAAIWTNIVYKTWPEIPIAERERLQEEGQISNSVEFEPYQGVESLRGLRVPHEPTGVPLLDMSTLPNGRGNTHTLEYLLIANKYYKPEGKYLVEHYPDAYLRSFIWSLTDWYPSSPTRDIVMPSTTNHVRVRKLDQAFNKAFLLDEQGRLRALLVLLPLAILYGIYRVFRLRGVLASERTIVVSILFMLLTIFYAALGTTLVSSGDFSRYRFDVDPFYLILLVTMATHILAGVARRVRRLRRA